MEEQAFLSTLPLKIKSRRRRASTNASKSEISTTANERLVQLNQDNPDHDSDETSSDDELGKLRKATLLDGAMTPTSLGTATGFVGLSCGKDAPNVHFVSPVKETPDILARPDLVDGSRFYVKRRIKIGNTSKFIPEGMSFGICLSDSSQTKSQDGKVHSQVDDLLCLTTLFRSNINLPLIRDNISRRILPATSNHRIACPAISLGFLRMGRIQSQHPSSILRSQ